MPSTALELSALRSHVKRFPIVLVTGGSGYIGSHTVLEVLKNGCAVIVVDNLVNSHMETLIRVYYVAKIEFQRLGRDPSTVPPLIFHQVNLHDRRHLQNVFRLWQMDNPPLHMFENKLELVNIGALASKVAYKMKYYDMDPVTDSQSLVDFSGIYKLGSINAVIHLAALKAVGESVAQPLQYYQNNIASLLNLLKCMAAFKVNRLVFSSSGMPSDGDKEFPMPGCTSQSPYRRSMWMAEDILNDCCVANPDLQVVALRYFKATGSHRSGLIQEDPKGTPNYMQVVNLGVQEHRRNSLYAYAIGQDTIDPKRVCEYVQVEDLARGHLTALRSIVSFYEIEPESVTSRAIETSSISATAAALNYRVYNMGTGQGYFGLKTIESFARIAGCDTSFTIPSEKSSELDWQREFDIQDMCWEVYNFAIENPTAYERLKRLASKDPSTVVMTNTLARLRHNLPYPGQKLTILEEDTIEGFVNLYSDPEPLTDILRKLSGLHTLSDESKKKITKSDAIPGSWREETDFRFLHHNEKWDEPYSLPIRTV